MPEELLLDPAAWRELQDTAGPEFTAELARTFLDEAPIMLAELHAALAGADADTFRRAAHSLKSNALTFGAGPLAQRARTLELGGIASGGPAALESLAALWRATAAEIEGHVDAA